MILAAERLFAARGLASVSAREIAVAAGQRNTSAVAYHFGSRDGLVDAIFDYRMARIDEQRRAMLAELDRTSPSGETVELRRVAETIIVPLAATLGHENGVSWYLRFIQQAVFTGGVDVLADSRADITRGLRDATTRVLLRLDHIPLPLRHLRVRRALQMASDGLAWQEQLLANGTAEVPTALVVADLVDAVVAALKAPVSPATAAALQQFGPQQTPADPTRSAKGVLS